MLVDECGSTNVGWGGPPGMRGGWSTPGGCRNSAMSFTGSVPSLHPAGSIRSLRSQHSQAPETPRRCHHCHPVHVGTPNNYVPHTPVQYYTPSHCMDGQNGTYTPHRGSYHGDPRVRCMDMDESMAGNTNWVLSDLRSLHRCVPALRRTGIDVAGMRTHFYPEGGWGWLVCAAGFLALLLTTGMQLAFGLLHVYAVRHLGSLNLMNIAWVGALSAAVSRGSAPLVVGACRRGSTRLTAVIGGFVLALASLFTSFALQMHQVVISYGLVLGAGAGLVRETAGLILGHYFKKRREFVEMVVQAGTGVGIALFSVFYKEAVGKLGWRLGLQSVTGALSLTFFLGLIYRSASLYHPQRRAIVHLKNQRTKVKEKKPNNKMPRQPFVDLSPLGSRPVRMLMLAAGSAAFGLYTPAFYILTTRLRWSHDCGPVQLATSEFDQSSCPECRMISWTSPSKSPSTLIQTWSFVYTEREEECLKSGIRVLQNETCFTCFVNLMQNNKITPGKLGGPIVCNDVMIGFNTRVTEHRTPGTPSTLLDILVYSEFIENVLSVATKPVNFAESSYIVSIQNRDIHICGGLILNRWWIITVENCVRNVPMNDLRIVGGIQRGWNEDHQPRIMVDEIGSVEPLTIGHAYPSIATIKAVQAYQDGLEASSLVLLQSCLGLAAALGCAAWGSVTARPSAQCLVSRQYLCQGALVGVAVAQIALGSVEGYHGLVLASGLYGASLGGALYSLKMLALERLRARHFARSWALVQAAEALPILLGVPLTGYMNAIVPRVGYYACTLSSLCGAGLLFLVGWGRQPSSPVLRASQLSHVSQQLPPPCACPPPPRPRLPKSQSLHVPLDVEQDMRDQPHTPIHPHFRDAGEQHSCTHEHYCQSVPYHTPLRPSKSVPEGLGNHNDTYRPRPRRYRDVTVIEQITTSV